MSQHRSTEVMASLGYVPVSVLTDKLWDSDPDIRYMSLNDLIAAFNGANAESLKADYAQSGKLVDGLLKTLNDPNGEVQNLTIKCLSNFVVRCHHEVLGPLLLEIAKLPTDSTLDSSISAMATRAIVVSLPHSSATAAARTPPVQQAYSAISNVLLPWLVGKHILSQKPSKQAPLPPKGLLVADLETGHDSGYIDVLTEVATCYGPMLEPEEIDALQKITLQILEAPRTSSVMRKRAVIALAALSRFFSDELLSQVLSHIMTVMTTPHLTHSLRRLYLSVLGSMARAIPSTFGPHLKTLAPFALGAVSQKELDDQLADTDDEEGRDPALDEVRESAFITLEAFMVSSPLEMQPYLADCLEATLRFIKYDPNLAAVDGDDDQDGNDQDGLSDADADDDFDIDEDFEEEGGLDDEDDVSWKVRRCATKTLSCYISVRSKDLLDEPETLDRIAHALVQRFNEREESVRIEMMQTLRCLIRSTTDVEIPVLPASAAAASATATSAATTTNDLTMPGQSLKRKRQRRTSDVSMVEAVKQRRITGSTSPEALGAEARGAAHSLTLVKQAFVNTILKLFKTSPLPTKQAALSVLHDFVVACHGGLSDHLTQLVGCIVDMLDASGSESHGTLNITSSTGNASGTTLQIEALRVLATTAKNHPSTDLQPLLPRVIPAVMRTVQSKSPKVSAEALRAVEQLVKLLTPPRSAADGEDSASQLEELLTAVTGTITSKSADTQVRSEAIHVLAVLVGRTLSPHGSRLLSPESRERGMELLYESSKNETTRYPAIKALEIVAALAPPETSYDTTWFSNVCLELGAQLRKANRSLRGASLQTLRTMLAERHASQNLNETAGRELVSMLTPLLSGKDLHMVGPSLVIFAALIHDSQFAVVTDDFTAALCELVADAIAVNVVDQLVDVVTAVGASGRGETLMSSLLKDVSMKGSPAVVGKLIGDLVVSGGDSVGISVDAFHKELQTSKDDKRKCLALSVLGEVGLRSGASSSASLSPELFTRYFDVRSPDVPLAAAVALGRAAAGRGNGKVYAPAILAAGNDDRASQYLVLHAVRELLTYSEHTDELEPFQAAIWDAAVAAARTDDNRTIAADCMANLAILHPRRHLAMLQELVSAGDDAGVRGAAILAFRDVLGGTDASFDKDLRASVVDVLTAMLGDAELDMRRSALNTFNAAARNKPALVMPHLGELLPLVVRHTHEDPSLVRDVKMGPFVHRVDDGLECRKTAYETLYTTVELAPPALVAPLLPPLYDRVVAGLGDDPAIRALCAIVVRKFVALSPAETQRRLDDMAERFRVILAVTPKDTAVRHEHERADEAKRVAVRLAVELARAFPDGQLDAKDLSSTQPQQQRWVAWWDEARVAQRKLVDDAQRDLRQREAP